MADDLEQLVLSISADTRQIQRALRKLDGDVLRNTRRVEGHFNAMGTRINAGLNRALGIVATGAFARQAQQLIDASTRITNALKVAGLEGEALNDVYGRLFQSAQENAAPLESLVTLYGRAATVQKELGVSTEELLGFTNNVALALRVAGTDSASASGALLQLSQTLGSGTVRAEEFNSILEGALPIAQAAAAGLDEAGGSVAKLRQLVIDGKVSSEAFFRAFEAGAVTLEQKVAGAQLTVAQGWTMIENAMVDAAGRINEGSQAGEDLAASLAAVAQAIRETDFSPLISGLATFITDVRTAINDLAAFNQAIESGDWGGAARALGFGRKPDEQQAAPASLPDATGGLGSSFGSAWTRRSRTVSLGDFAAPSSTGAGGRSREDAWARETRQIQEATEALRVELETIGQTEFARDKARAALELENAARRAGITLNDEHRTKIESLTDAYATASEAARKAAEDQRKAEQAASEFYDTFKSGIKDAITGAGSFSDALDQILNKLVDMALNSAFDALFQPSSGGSGGGVFGSIFSGIGSLFGFASGTPNTGGRRGQVRGLVHGQEAVIPLPTGGEVPVDLRLPDIPAAAVGAVEPAQVTVAIVSGEMFDARVQSISGSVSAQIVKQNNKSVTAIAAQDQRRFG